MIKQENAGESKTVSTEEKQAGMKSQMRSCEYLHTRYHKEVKATEYEGYYRKKKLYNKEKGCNRN